MGRILNHIAISDIHCGVSKISPDQLYKNFSTYIYPELTAEVDILTCSGDFFDGIIYLNSRMAYIILKIIRELQEFAIKHKFYIRILRGTYSHDRDQLKIFNLIDKNKDQLYGINIIKVYEKMDYEYIEPLDLKIAYIPDDLPYDDDYIAFKNMLNTHKIDSVNILLSHSYYDHNIPQEYEKYIAKKLNSDIMQYVTNAILNGHIHITSVYRHNITIGSFECTRHGEPNKKGFYKLSYDPKLSGNTYSFIRNTNVLIFKTITLDDIEHNHDLAINRVKSVLSELYKGGTEPLYIRIITNDRILLEVITMHIKRNYKNIIVTLSRSNKQKLKDRIITSTVKSLPLITPNNICLYTQKFLSSLSVDMELEDIKIIFDEIREK